MLPLSNLKVLIMNPAPFLLDVVNMHTFTHTKRWFLLWKAKGPMRIQLQDPCVSKYSIIVLSDFQHSIARWKCNITEKATPQDESVRHSAANPIHPGCPAIFFNGHLKDLRSSSCLPSSLKKEGFSDLSQWVDQYCTKAKWCVNIEQKDAVETKELRSCFYVKDDWCLFFFFCILQAGSLICPVKH